MSNKIERDEQFWEITDKIIGTANELCDSHKNGKVNSALLFSAARFSAFMLASTAKDKVDFQNDRELAIEYFTQQFQQALKDNLQDYEKNFADYLPEKS